MPKLHIMKGLPASGKSTFAKKFVKDSGNTVRINRDDLRAMCFESAWSGPREKFIIAAEKALALAARDIGLNAIIDDTNLRGDMWEQWAKENGMEPVVHDLRHVPINVCLNLDRGRNRSVGAGVIHRMALGAGMTPFTGRPIVICDLDGTIADLRHRLHYIESAPKDYHGFFLAQADDPPIQEVIDHVKGLADNHDIVIVSGRPDTYAGLTERWLAVVARIPYVSLLMRRGGDHRPDDMVKEEILAMLPRENIVLAIDDRISVIERVWEANGIAVCQVTDGKMALREAKKIGF